ncbi:fatty-acyl-CoA synthase [Saccharata proteae CBS 121410]|uniref:Very long-chain fatty acid transport protein n=1 Tax=Saccharata proteae CBS 121410 TaxID=1314787 RepID=A0A9P4I0K7_9PEZI|nr:fatty-acyl-CoA synthase [Saccharata proteae CBS 121410]
MSLPLAAVASVVGIGAYLNAKFHIGHDLRYKDLSRNAQHVENYFQSRASKSRLLIWHVLEEHAAVRPHHPFLVFDAASPERREWSYAQFVDSVNRVGSWLIEELGIEVGEIVALDGGNSPEYLMLWFALDAIGAVPSFINCNLTSKGLVHCVQICKCRYLLADSDVTPLVEPHVEELQDIGVKTIYYSPSQLAALQKTSPLPRSRSEFVDANDLRGLVYTSGTTGLPKAVVIPTGRDLLTGYCVAHLLSLTPNSRMYTCMPLYHGAAHALCTTAIIHAGGTIVLGRKFSHSRFWPEVRAAQANIIQYVGELCRYLINAPPDPKDKNNNVEMAWGNGMRADVWEPFRERFGIPVIHELYAATDGMGSVFNKNKGEFTRHALALRGLMWKLRRGGTEALVKLDLDDGDAIVRDKDGWAVRAKTNEPGEMLYLLDQTLENHGYTGYFDNPGASEKRKIRDVFKKGDLWFRSGDMMRFDKDGRYYFVDRLGDTYRWKSENVSTNEVSDVIGSFPQIAEANVYGVSVPRSDGRAGCAAITFPKGVTEGSFDWKGLVEHARRNLPRYAVPLFLRLTEAIDYTGTMKMQKGRLRLEGVDVVKVEGTGDRLYWLPVDGEAYVRFTAKEFEALQSGQTKL